MVSDVEAALQEKFFVNTKLISRETSTFKDDPNTSTELAGVRIQFDLPRYGRLHVVSLEVWILDQDVSPEFIPTDIEIKFYKDDENGEILYETLAPVEIGKNTIFIDQDFEANKIFIAYDPNLSLIKQTENKTYSGFISKFSNMECYFPCFGGTTFITQVNGGGINAVFDVYCSAEKFVCQNINLFKKTLWWKVGQELVIERRYGNRLNQFTTMTEERAEELTSFFQAQYTQSLGNSLKAHNIDEDPFCFECKGSVNVQTNLP